MSSKKILQLPDMSLARGDLSESSPEYLREFVKEHGSTAPLKIERRRKKLSPWVDFVEKAIGKAQTFKKASQAEISRVINAVEAALKKAEAGPEKDQLMQQYGALKWQKVAQEYELNEQVRRCIVDFCMVEGICLVIDSLTIRATVQNTKTGKKGKRRYTVAGIVSDVGVDTEYGVGLWRMVAKRWFPDGIVPPEFNPESESFRKDDDGEIDDDDVMSDEEEREIEAKSKIEDEE